MWTEARRRGHSIDELSRWLSSAPAKLIGLDQRKGSIAAGCDADLVIWKPDREFRVSPELIHHRHKLTPYAGRTLAGAVQQTFLRGQKIYDEGAFSDGPTGALLAREERGSLESEAS
jgi:allantoinase